MSKFKIGDRVRFVRDNTDSGSKYGAKGEVVTVTDLNGYDDNKVDVTSSHLSWNPSAYVADLELLPVAAQQPAFTIEAGRYYKTRDGRKVGPMIPNDVGFIEKRGDGRVWEYHGARREGCFHMPLSDEIIAEWRDTPPVSAQVDAIAEEYGPAVAKPKFKVGDRVVALEDSAFSVKKGAVYTVVEVLDEDIRFRKDDGTIDGWSAKFFAVTTTPTTPAIVALIENGQPKPSVIPHVHAGQAAAEREAKRLAGVHKGQQFGVFVLASVSEEAKPVYAHEWQRLAAKGDAIPAVMALHRLTGMGIKPAKDAVEYFLQAA